ncbi:hypothetical protein DFH09DRAFT_1089518 [Mycena vulgaris]|nr:hypothetical protein DFH09DRAFT_1089518 [Mycena vulgaris]
MYEDSSGFGGAKRVKTCPLSSIGPDMARLFDAVGCDDLGMIQEAGQEIIRTFGSITILNTYMSTPSNNFSSFGQDLSSIHPEPIETWSNRSRGSKNAQNGIFPIRAFGTDICCNSSTDFEKKGTHQPFDRFLVTFWGMWAGAQGHKVKKVKRSKKDPHEMVN